MRILLLGEYSNVHWTLAEGLRALGHEVCVVSNGDYWKDYRRDVSLVRRSYGRWDSLVYMAQVWKALRQMRDYDVVQIINPMFLEMKSERIRPIYEYLRKHNKRMFMGAYGMDYYWVNTCRTTQTFRYSDFNFGDRLRTDDIAMAEVRDWIGTDKGRLNQEIAADCDGIAAGLYEYYACYHPAFPDKTEFIPFPINTDTTVRTAPPVTDKVRFFIGVQKSRGMYKGTDVMLRALERVADRHPDRCEIVKAESVPFPVYQHMMDSSHALLDQLYSYTPRDERTAGNGKRIGACGRRRTRELRYSRRERTASHRECASRRSRRLQQVGANGAAFRRDSQTQRRQPSLYRAPPRL